MTMTSRFDDWLAYAAQQDRLLAALFLLAFSVAAVVWYCRRWRRRLLWLALGGFWLSLLALLAMNPPVIGRPSWGVLIDEPLWYDEIFTWHMARLPIDEMVQATAGDVHPPLWYAIEHVAIQAIGDSEAALRLPSLAFGLASVALCYALARALGYDVALSVACAGMLALMPGFIWYAQEARMYALLQAAVLLATVGLVTGRRWLMGIGMVITLYSHNLGVFAVLPIGLLSLWLEWEGRFPWRTVATGVGVVAAWSPWLATLLRQTRDISDGFWIQAASLGGYLRPFYRVIVGMGIASWLEQHAVLVAGGMLGLALWAGLRPRFRHWFPLAMIIGPTAGLLLASLAWRPIYLSRFFVVTTPFLAILLSVGLSKLETPTRSAILAGLVPMLLLGVLWQGKGTESYTNLIAEIREHLEPGDVVWHGNLASYIQLSYYLPEARHVCHPTVGDLEQSLTLETQAALGIGRREAHELDVDRYLVIWAENPLTTVDEVEALGRALDLGQARKLLEWHEDNPLVHPSLWEVRRAH